jgi:hypothetical protein
MNEYGGKFAIAASIAVAIKIMIMLYHHRNVTMTDQVYSSGRAETSPSPETQQQVN